MRELRGNCVRRVGVACFTQSADAHWACCEVDQAREGGSTTTMDETLYRFGRCEVHPLRMEVLLDGIPRPLERKIFGVLLYLIEQRSRVVSKEELLDVFWRDRGVSVGVVTRAVMMARQAIGDGGRTPVLIRTVHRTGYRFVADLQALPALDVRATEGPAEDTSLAVLPFENASGRTELDWVELGLMAMVAKALAADERLAVAPNASVMLALSSEPEHADLSQRVRAVRQTVGVSHVLQARVSEDAQGPTIDYVLAPSATRTRLRGDSLIDIARQVARDVQCMLLPETTSQTRVAFDSSDGLANQALASAMQAAAEQKWKTAANLLHVVLEAEPQNLAVRLEHLVALASLADAQAVSLGRELLAEPAVRAEPLMEARVHQALGMAYNNLRLFTEATTHLDEALWLSQGHDKQPWAVTTVLLRSSIAIGQMDLAAAQRLLERARRLWERSSNQVHRLGWMVNTALVAAKSGDMVRAVDIGREAVEFCRRHRLHSYLAVTSLNLSHACLGLGLLRSAVHHAEEAMTTAQALGERFRTASTGDTLCLLYRELRAAHELQRVASQVRLIEHELAPPTQAYLQMTRGHLAAVEQRHEDAAVFFGKAVSLARALGEWLQFHESMPWLITALIQAGRLDEADEAWREANALPGVAHDDELRAALLHCQALRAHAVGQRIDALRLLRECAEVAPMGLWRAHACLNSAWLHLEDGEPGTARHLLRDLGAWLAEHPAGRLVQARLLSPRAIRPRPCACRPSTSRKSKGCHARGHWRWPTPMSTKHPRRRPRCHVCLGCSREPNAPARFSAGVCRGRRRIEPIPPGMPTGR